MKSFWRNPFVSLLTCFVLSFLLLAYPIYVIRPFRYQGARELSIALQVMRVRPALVIALALLAAILAFMAWKRMRRLLPRMAVVVLSALTVIAGGLSRMINCVPVAVPGDKIPAIVLASGFSNQAKDSVGTVLLLRHDGDPRLVAAGDERVGKTERIFARLRELLGRLLRRRRALSGV